MNCLGPRKAPKNMSLDIKTNIAFGSLICSGKTYKIQVWDIHYVIKLTLFCPPGGKKKEAIILANYISNVSFHTSILYASYIDPNSIEIHIYQ